MNDKLTITADSLGLQDVVDVARNDRKIAISPTLLAQFDATKAYIAEHWMHDEAPLIYSLNTGVGSFKDRRVDVSDIEQYQRNLILSHATGLGEAFARDVVRATLLLRLNAFAADVSGISSALAQRFVDFLNAGLTPVVPCQGSVGASGDLAPLAHLSGALCGFAEAEIDYQGRRLAAAQAIEQAGLEVDLVLGAKDASAMLNGSTVSLAIAALAVADAENVVRHADLGLALSLEAMRGEKDAFDPALHATRPHKGQALVARNVLSMVGQSQRMTAAARDLVFPGEDRAPGQPASKRVQDPYSMRCAPQVHGPARDALAYVRGVIETEINSATDNPLILHDGDNRRAISGGHFHGQYVAQTMDFLAIALADLASICERRVARLIDPVMSFGLARNLASGTPGLNTGYATVQCSLSSLVMENRTLATPASVDSIPGKGNAEDHVSNSTWCARKAAQVSANTATVVAGEILVAAQALSMVDDIAAGFPPAGPMRALVEALREVVPQRQDGDVWFAADIKRALALLESASLLDVLDSVGVQIE
ncbi:MAG: aromatic amino acid ammonia-lyase [Gammaproteobacteria bacterium]